MKEITLRLMGGEGGVGSGKPYALYTAFVVDAPEPIQATGKTPGEALYALAGALDQWMLAQRSGEQSEPLAFGAIARLWRQA